MAEGTFLLEDFLSSQMLRSSSKSMGRDGCRPVLLRDTQARSAAEHCPAPAAQRADEV